MEAKYFDGNRFFRVLHNFMAQFGVNGDPEVGDDLSLCYDCVALRCVNKRCLYAPIYQPISNSCIEILS